MKIIVDENIAFAADALKQFGNVQLVNGREITNEKIKTADALIVRSVTQVDEKLLANTNVKFVGTATIGTDHINLNYLKKAGIVFADAKGSNADSVAEYVFTALFKIAAEEKISLKKKTIGVVGIGNIGSRVVKIAAALGMNVLKNDPPLERNNVGSNYTPLNKIFDADIITLHVPLNMEGIDKTFHLLDEYNLNKIKNGAIIINTSRGAVIDNEAISKFAGDKNLKLILDVWENEPYIDIKLLGRAKIGTPHIAGYSLEGKANGTKMIYDALCRFANTKPSWQPDLPAVNNSSINLTFDETIENSINILLKNIYNIEQDDKNLRKLFTLDEKERGNYFDTLRKEYPARREFSNYTVTLENSDTELQHILKGLRFKIKNAAIPPPLAV